MDSPEHFEKLRKKQNTRFIEYQLSTGVSHFSKYGYVDSDDTDDDDVMNKTAETLTPKETTSKPARTSPVIMENYLRYNNITDNSSVEFNKDWKSNKIQQYNEDLYKKSEIDIPKCTLMKSTFFNEDDTDLDINDNIYNYEENDFELLNEVHFSMYESISPELIDEPEMNTLQENILSPLILSNCIVDITLFKGSSYKIGWTKELTMFCLAKYENKPFNSEYTLVSIQKLEVLHEEAFKNLEQHLECQYKYSNYDKSNEFPYFYSCIGSNMLHEQQDIVKDLPIDNYEKQIWNLIAILFDDSGLNKFHRREIESYRKQNLCSWIRSIVDNAVENEVNSSTNNFCKIFSYISGCKINEAANVAMESNNFNLAMLISQLPSGKLPQIALKTQLNFWETSDCFNFFDKTMLKVYALLAGNILINSETSTILAFENLDWIRTLGLYLWYITKKQDPICKAIKLYEEMIIQNNDIQLPLPTHNNTRENIYDLRFQLIKFYCDSKYLIENVLNTEAYTNDPLDYRLSWFVFQALHSLNQDQMSIRVKHHMHINFASQLENMGLWHWSVYVLTYIKNNKIKKELISDIIGRHVLLHHEETPDYVKREKMLIEKFHISHNLIESQKALKAIQIGYCTDAVYYSLFAEKWKNTIDLAMRYFIPSHLLTCNYEYLIRMLSPISEHKLLLPDWEKTGGLILDFSMLGLQYNSILSYNDSFIMQQQLTEFKKTAVYICMRVKHYKPMTYLEQVCLAEISKRIAIMLRKLISVINGYSNDLGIATAINVQALPITSDNLKQELNAIILENLDWEESKSF